MVVGIPLNCLNVSQVTLQDSTTNRTNLRAANRLQSANGVKLASEKVAELVKGLLILGVAEAVKAFGGSNNEMLDAFRYEPRRIHKINKPSRVSNT